VTKVAEFLEKEGLGEGTPLRRWDEAAQTYIPLEPSAPMGGGRYRVGPKPGEGSQGKLGNYIGRIQSFVATHVLKVAISVFVKKMAKWRSIEIEIKWRELWELMEKAKSSIAEVDVPITVRVEKKRKVEKDQEFEEWTPVEDLYEAIDVKNNFYRLLETGRKP
jgi:hypothetical protein